MVATIRARSALIPLARGGSRSDTVANIVTSARSIAAQGVKEIVITGVNTGDFGLEESIRKKDLSTSLKALDEVEGIERFRISSIEPIFSPTRSSGLSPRRKRFVPHFHIPLQSGSNTTLKAMRRRYQRELYAGRVQKDQGADAGLLYRR